MYKVQEQIEQKDMKPNYHQSIVRYYNTNHIIEEDGKAYNNQGQSIETVRCEIIRTHPIKFLTYVQEMKFNDECNSIDKIFKNDDKRCLAEKNKLYKKRYRLENPIEEKYNRIKMLKVTHEKKGKVIKQYKIEKDLMFEYINDSGKRRRCKVEGFHPYIFGAQYDNNIEVKIRYVTNNRIGRADWDRLIPYGHKAD